MSHLYLSCGSNDSCLQNVLHVVVGAAHENKIKIISVNGYLCVGVPSTRSNEHGGRWHRAGPTRRVNLGHKVGLDHVCGVEQVQEVRRASPSPPRG
jgi:hypothetical protein